MFFECSLTPLSADSSLNYRIYRGKIVLSLHNLSHTHSCDQKATGVSLCIAQVPVFVLRKCVYCACPTGLAHSVSLQLEFKTNNDLKIIIESSAHKKRKTKINDLVVRIKHWTITKLKINVCYLHMTKQCSIIQQNCLLLLTNVKDRQCKMLLTVHRHDLMLRYGGSHVNVFSTEDEAPLVEI